MKTQIFILLISILVYLIWALIHHRRDKSLTLEVFIEYLLTGLLALVLLAGTIY
jgi:hypothetical protein